MNGCIVCGNQFLGRLFKAKEMMFGTRVEYTYLECSKCGCLQMQDASPGEGDYPDQYVSFQEPPEEADTILKNLKLSLRKFNAQKCLDSKSIIGKLSRTLRGEHYLYRWLRRANVSFDAHILDIGCGIGELLLYLRTIGFSSLTGIDPYIKKDIVHTDGVKIYKRAIHDMSDTFDFIILNHSIEHLPDPVSACTHIRKLLKPGGHVLVRTPIASSYAFRKYGSAWAAIDAPRHKVIHTLSSMYILASGVGFQVVNVEYDSTPFQFIASEQFSRNIATTEPKSYYVSSRDSIFSKSQIRAFSKLARYLNEIGDGDSACFLLR